MGQTWSKFMPGQSEADNTPPAPETEVGPSTPDPNVAQSEASTEASSSVPIYQGDPFSVAGADVELSSLKDSESEEEERDQERGKETQTTPTPTPSTSQHLSPLQAFLKGPEKLAHLKKSQSQASPSTGLQKMYSRKSRAFKQQPHPSSPRLIQHHAPKMAAEPAKRVRTQQESSTPSPSQVSPPQAQEDEALEVDDEGDAASQSPVAEPEDDVKVESGEELMQPLLSSAQKLLLFELDRKRKVPAGLPSLAVECMGESRMKLTARTSLEKSRDNSEGGQRKRVMDLGEAAVGRRMKKAVGSRSISKGHVALYDASSRLYQIEYDNGKEETMEWLDLEPCLEQSKTASAPVEDVKGTTTLRKSLRNAARAKKVEDFVYTKRAVRGRRRKK